MLRKNSLEGLPNPSQQPSVRSGDPGERLYDLSGGEFRMSRPQRANANSRGRPPVDGLSLCSAPRFAAEVRHGIPSAHTRRSSAGEIRPERLGDVGVINFEQQFRNGMLAFSNRRGCEHGLAERGVPDAVGCV